MIPLFNFLKIKAFYISDVKWISHHEQLPLSTGIRCHLTHFSANSSLFCSPSSKSNSGKEAVLQLVHLYFSLEFSVLLLLERPGEPDYEHKPWEKEKSFLMILQFALSHTEYLQQILGERYWGLRTGVPTCLASVVPLSYNYITMWYSTKGWKDRHFSVKKEF